MTDDLQTIVAFYLTEDDTSRRYCSDIALMSDAASRFQLPRGAGKQLETPSFGNPRLKIPSVL